jgi:hypothetical protein
MCGAPKTQEIVTRTELDPDLRRLLYGGIFQGPPTADPMGSGANTGGGDSGSNNDRDQSSTVMGGGYGGSSNNIGQPLSAPGMSEKLRYGSDAPLGGNKPGDGSLYAMGGMVSPQQGLASLNQGQMPMMNGQLPNLSDPMTAATLAMALRSPQMQYGSIAQNPMMQTNFNVGGYVEGPGTGTSDSIDSVIMQNGRPVQQAKLSDGEFVMTERAVKGAGNGDREAGAARMYELMQKFERGGRV